MFHHSCSQKIVPFLFLSNFGLQAPQTHHLNCRDNCSNAFIWPMMYSVARINWLLSDDIFIVTTSEAISYSEYNVSCVTFDLCLPFWQPLTTDILLCRKICTIHVFVSLFCSLQALIWFGKLNLLDFLLCDIFYSVAFLVSGMHNNSVFGSTGNALDLFKAKV